MAGEAGKVGEAFVSLRYAFDRLHADFKKAEAQVQAHVKQTESRFATIGTALAGAFAGFSIGNVFADTLRTAGEFETKMNRLAGVSEATAAQMKALTAQAIDLGARTSFSAGEAADAMGELAQAGFKVDQIMQAVPGVMDLAAAAQTDLATAADIAGTALNQYGLAASEVGRVNDVLTATGSKTATNLVEVGTALRYVGPLAKSLDISLEETAAALGTLSDAGLKGEQAGTALRGVFSRLINPSKEVWSTLSAAGVTVEDLNFKTGGLQGVLERLAPKLTSVSDIAHVFGTEAQVAAKFLLDNRDAAAQLTAELGNVDGAAKRLGETNMAGFEGSLKALGGAFESLKLAIANSGVLEIATQFVNLAADLVAKLGQADPAILKFGAAFAGIVAMVTPVVAVLGGLALGIGALGGAPVLAGIAAVAAAGGAFVAFSKDITAALAPALAALDKLQERLTGFGQQQAAEIKSFFSDPISSIKTLATEGSAAFAKQAAAAAAASKVTAKANGQAAASAEQMTQRVTAATQALALPQTQVSAFALKAADDFKELERKVTGQSYYPDMIAAIGANTALLQGNMVGPVTAATDQVAGRFQQLGKDVAGSTSSFAVPAPANDVAARFAPVPMAKPADAEERAARQQRIADINLEIQELQRLNTAQGISVAEYQRVAEQIEGERAARESGLSVKSAEGAAISALTIEQNRLTDALARAREMQDLELELSELQRLTAAQMEGQAAYHATAKAIEVERAAREMGLTPMDAEYEKLKLLTEARYELENAPDPTVTNAFAGATAAMEDFVLDATSYGTIAGRAMTRALGEATTGIADVMESATGGFKEMKDTAEEVFSSFLKTLKRQLLEFMAQQLVMSFLSMFVGGPGAAGAAGAAGRATPLMIGGPGGQARPYGKGGIPPGSGISAYSNSIVSRPTLFPFAKGVGLMGEKGKETILPLRRGARGELGVMAANDSASGRPANVNIQVIDQRGAGAPPVEQRRSTGADGREQVTMIIRSEVKKTIARGDASREMAGRHGVSQALRY